MSSGLQLESSCFPYRQWGPMLEEIEEVVSGLTQLLHARTYLPGDLRSEVPRCAGGRWRCVQYWVRRARLSLAMMEQLDMTGRTGELARAFGIDFFSVLTRGSQYRVEAMMVRLAHTQNYLLPAPSKQQVRAPIHALTCRVAPACGSPRLSPSPSFQKHMDRVAGLTESHRLT